VDGNYIAMIVALIVWAGLFFFIAKVDRQVKELEKRSQ